MGFHGQERTVMENVEKEVTKHSNHAHHSTSMPDTPEQQNTPKLVVSESVCVEDVEDEKNQNRRKLTVRAFRGQADPLSNFYNIGGKKLHYSGKSFNSSEQAYQYTKAIFHGEKNLSKEILRTTDPHRIKKLGDFRESVAWKKEKVAVLICCHLVDTTYSVTLRGRIKTVYSLSCLRSMLAYRSMVSEVG